MRTGRPAEALYGRHCLLLGDMQGQLETLMRANIAHIDELGGDCGWLHGYVSCDALAFKT
jgi:hypothetical protein